MGEEDGILLTDLSGQLAKEERRKLHSVSLSLFPYLPSLPLLLHVQCMSKSFLLRKPGSAQWYIAGGELKYRQMAE